MADYHGDAYLYEGLSSLGQAIGNYADRLKEAKAYRQMAVDGLHMDPGEVDHYSLDQLKGKMRGIAFDQEMKLRAAQLDNYAAAAQLRKQAVEDDQGVMRGLNEYGQALSEEGQPGQNTDLTGEGNLEDAVPATTERQAVARALKASGGGRAGVQLLDSLMRYRQLAGDEAPRTVPGPFQNTMLLGGRGGGWSMVADPEAKHLQGGAPEEMKLSDGTLVLYNRKTGLFAFPPNEKANATAQAQLDLLNQRNEAKWFDSDTTFEDQNGLMVAVRKDGSKMPVGKTSSTQAFLNKFGQGGAATAPDRVTVQDKDGKKFTVPRAQLKEAIAKGYTEVKK